MGTNNYQHHVKMMLWPYLTLCKVGTVAYDGLKKMGVYFLANSRLGWLPWIGTRVVNRLCVLFCPRCEGSMFIGLWRVNCIFYAF